jgi:hypothetical protein
VTALASPNSGQIVVGLSTGVLALTIDPGR